MNDGRIVNEEVTQINRSPRLLAHMLPNVHASPFLFSLSLVVPPPSAPPPLSLCFSLSFPSIPPKTGEFFLSDTTRVALLFYCHFNIEINNHVASVMRLQPYVRLFLI